MEMKDFSLEGKVAWVTGASYGIGFAIASAFATAGAKIVFNDIKQQCRYHQENPYVRDEGRGVPPGHRC